MSDRTRLELCDLLDRLQKLYMETARTIEDIRNTIYNSDEEYDYESEYHKNSEWNSGFKNIKNKMSSKKVLNAC